MEEVRETIKSRLFTEGGPNVFAVLDGASVPDLLEKLSSQRPAYECLYRGELKPDMAEVAPYLVHLERDSEFAGWILSKGWGNHWGVFALSQSGLVDLRQHFRKLLVVHDSAGQPLYFRYYDPRVLRAYLKTCNAQDLAGIFGPVAAYVLEGEDASAALRFRCEAGTLIRKEEKLAPL